MNVSLDFAVYFPEFPYNLAFPVSSSSLLVMMNVRLIVDFLKHAACFSVQLVIRYIRISYSESRILASGDTHITQIR